MRIHTASTQVVVSIYYIRLSISVTYIRISGSSDRMDGWILITAAAFASAVVIAKLVRFILADADSSLLALGDHKPNAFEGKVVWITGASQGLGLVLAKHLAAHGAKIILSSRDRAKLEVRIGLYLAGDMHTCHAAMYWGL